MEWARIQSQIPIRILRSQFVGWQHDTGAHRLQTGRRQAFADHFGGKSFSGMRKSVPRSPRRWLESLRSGQHFFEAEQVRFDSDRQMCGRSERLERFLVRSQLEIPSVHFENLNGKWQASRENKIKSHNMLVNTNTSLTIGIDEQNFVVFR